MITMDFYTRESPPGSLVAILADVEVESVATVVEVPCSVEQLVGLRL